MPHLFTDLPTASILVVAVMCCNHASLSKVQSASQIRTVPDSIASLAIRVDLTLCHLQNGEEPPLFKIAADRGFAKLSRFIEVPSRYHVGHSPPPWRRNKKHVCLAAALDVALRALPQFEGPHSPDAIAQSQPIDPNDCGLRPWFNRETAVLATVSTNHAQWPKPTLTHQQETTLFNQNNSWIFFVTAADLSKHWYWLIVPRFTTDGNVSVRLISER